MFIISPQKSVNVPRSDKMKELNTIIFQTSGKLYTVNIPSFFKMTA